MSNFAILRLRKRDVASASVMARHALRDGGPDVRSADRERAQLNRILVGPSRSADAIKALREALPEKRRKNAVEAIELLITASPEAMHAKSEAAQDAYFRDALTWIGDRFGGGANIRLAVVLRDQTTPHMRVLLTPLLDGKLNGSRLVGGPAQMRQMQTDYAVQVGAKHGLERGIAVQPGEAKPRRWYPAIAAAGTA